MNKIDKAIADRIITYLIDISNDKLDINEENILAEEDEGMQEILVGLKHLSEDLIFNKEKILDVTDMVTLKNNLLIQQNSELEHFAYVISHDLKAPLLGIHTLASFIEEDIENGKKDDVLSNLSILKERIARMEKLIEGILEFSKIGMVKSNKEIIDLNELAQETFDSLDSPDNFEFKLQNNLPEIYGIRSLFIQLFLNLTSNAIKFNDKIEGSLYINYEDLGFEHQFTFKDNGPGIPKKYQEKIFAVFQTLNNTDSFKNTGIGLSITKKIVSSLNGLISVESELNKGTSFVIRIPKDELT